jgi:hypothetical protein
MHSQSVVFVTKDKKKVYTDNAYAKMMMFPHCERWEVACTFGFFFKERCAWLGECQMVFVRSPLFINQPYAEVVIIHYRFFLSSSSSSTQRIFKDIPFYSLPAMR